MRQRVEQTSGAGHYLKYDIDKTLRGTLWIGITGAATLVTLLASEKQIILFLYEKPFRYRSAATKDGCRVAEGHPLV